MAAHAVVNAEFRLRSPDGGWQWTNVRAAPIRGAEGRIEKWVGLNIDIDVRKRRVWFRDGDEGDFVCQLAHNKEGCSPLPSRGLSDRSEMGICKLVRRVVAKRLGQQWPKGSRQSRLVSTRGAV